MTFANGVSITFAVEHVDLTRAAIEWKLDRSSERDPTLVANLGQRIARGAILLHVLL
jgi:hypothetical protein